MSRANLFVLITFAFLISLSISGYLTPEHVEEHIKRLISQKYQLYVINLGTSVNNNPLKAYVISGIKKQQNHISELRNYPATLITSYMHPREPYSVKLMQTLLDDVLNNYNSDFFFRYMLDHTLLILFPFVNIDGYYLYHKLTDDGASQTTKQQYRKNLNKYGKCLMEWQYGVDINRNFDSSWGSLRTSDDECGQQYRGPNPFSQKQSKAIKTLYNKFKINMAIDIHSYGNQWIYPYASQQSNSKLQSHKLYPLYQDLFESFKIMKRPMKSCYQSLGYTADGVYIDWALDQGALSFAVQVGTKFDGDLNIGNELLFQVQEAFHKVLRKNSISYSNYVTRSNELVIVSTSLLDFDIEVARVDGTVIGTQTLKSLQLIMFQNNDDSQYLMVRVKNTKVQQKVELSTLKLIDTTDIPNYQGNVSVYIIKRIFKILIVVISCLGIAGGAYFVYRKNNSNSATLSIAKPRSPTSQQPFHDNLQASSAQLTTPTNKQQSNTRKNQESVSLTSNIPPSDAADNQDEEYISTDRQII